MRDAATRRSARRSSYFVGRGAGRDLLRDAVGAIHDTEDHMLHAITRDATGDGPAPRRGYTGTVSATLLAGVLLFAPQVDGMAAEPAEFRNVLEYGSRCYADFPGDAIYLVNTDPGARYRVTVRREWMGSDGRVTGTDSPYFSEAGGRKHIGCTEPGDRTRLRIVGEVRL